MMSLRQAFKTKLPQSLLRSYCSASKLVDVQVDDKSGIATVTMQRAPVNGLNLELLTDLSDALTDLDNNNARGMILTSSNKTIFSAGLDIMEMYKPKPERVRQFWSTLQDVWMQLYGSSFPTVAAINGHSPAGGCLLAMCCEYRVMVNNYTIGLNETQLGIVAPDWFMATMKNTISARETELALTSGRLYTTEEALNVGLVDEVAADKDECLAKAQAFFKRFARINPMARMFTKHSLRSKDIQALADKKEEDIQTFLTFVNDPRVQKGLEMYLEALKKKAKK